jgi:hypothetical protein
MGFSGAGKQKHPDTVAVAAVKKFADEHILANIFWPSKPGREPIMRSAAHIPFEDAPFLPSSAGPLIAKAALNDAYDG